MLYISHFYNNGGSPSSTPEGATGPNGGNQGAGDCYGYDEKD